MRVKYKKAYEIKGLVTHRAGDRIVVETELGLFTCSSPKKLRFHHATKGGVLVGDNVVIAIDTIDDTLPVDIVKGEANIVEVSARKNAFFRGNPAMLHQPQGISANLDHVIVLGAVEERMTPLGLIDRLVGASQCCQGVDITILWNKIDLLPPQTDFMQTEFYTIYHAIGYKVLGISVQNMSITELTGLFPAGRTLIIGASGVGKSSLLNRVLPDLELATNPISKTSGKGVHTTTNAHLYRLSDTIEIIDTPGVKSYILDGVAENLVDLFPEFQSYAAECKFADCRHWKDQGCAIREAVEQGKIAPSRYQSYLSLLFADSETR